MTSPRLIALWCIVLALLAACAPATPTVLPSSTPQQPTATPTPTPTLTPTPTATPTPTPTPIPPLQVAIRWPEQVSALQAVPVEVEVVPPAGISVPLAVSALVRQPDGDTYWFEELAPVEEYWYRSTTLVRVPLQPLPGEWRVVVFVESTLPAAGERVRYFEPVPVPVIDFTADPVFPSGVELQVPLDFAPAGSGGDSWAGMRLWRAEGGELGLWWAPGPTEVLELSTAVVILEATYPAESAPQVLDVAEVEWHGQPAFLFREQWPGSEGGMGEALVVRGPDFWLYVLRVRTVGGQGIPEILTIVRDTFGFATGD